MTYIVAEIGVNWDGDFELAKKMIESAKTCGCDAVKFQAYDENIVKNHPQKERLLKTTINKSNIERIDNLAKNVSMEWFCTPMYPGAVELLDPFVERFKIREFDARTLIKNEKSTLLDNIFNTNKQVIASSEVVPPTIDVYDGSKIKWLYCVPKYPCILEDLKLNHLNEFDGFSNHCPDIIAPITAAILGSKIIEIHVTSDKSKDFIDNNVSFDFTELAELIRLIRDSEKISKN